MSWINRKAAKAAAITAGVMAVAGVGATLAVDGAQPASAATQRHGVPRTGPEGGLLSRSKFTIASAVKVDLTNEFVRLPLHRGEFGSKTVWYVLTDASDAGVADELGLNYAPKLDNAGVGCSACVQDVTLTGAPGNAFGEGTLHFQGVPDFSPTRVVKAGPTGFPPAQVTPGGVGDAKYSPFVRIAGSTTVYNAPIVATGDAPFDVDHHANTSDRVLAIHPAEKDSGQAQFHGASVDILFARGFDSGKPIVYLSQDADDEATATLERATFAPALKGAPFLGGDDFAGSVRERIFPFVNGQTGARNPQAQGLAHVIADGHATEDASLRNRSLIDALRRGGDPLNVQGDFPTLEENNRRASYSPLWEAQFGEWTQKAVKAGLNRRQTDEFQILNLAKTRPDLLTAPGGKPYGSVKSQINCPVVAYLDDEPKRDLVEPLPGSAADFAGSYFQG